MKKHLFSILAVAALLFTACETDDTVNNADDDYVAPELELSATEVTVEAEAGDVKTVTVTTDQDAVSAVVDYANKTWLDAKVENKVVSIIVTGDNPDPKERTGYVNVMVGEKGVTAEARITVTQKPNNKPLLEFESAEDVYLGKKADETASVGIHTNQSGLTAAVEAGAQSWLKAEIADGKLVVTTLSENTETSTRSGSVTVTAGELSISLNVIQAGTPKSIVGTAYGTEGIIFWQNPENPTQYKVISAKAEKRAWGPSGSVGVTESTLSGPEAAAIIKQASGYNSSSYALGFCEGLGEGWYLPTKQECEDLFTTYNGISRADGATVNTPNNLNSAEKAARKAFDNVMGSIGGVLLNTMDESSNGDSSWACQETTDGSKAWYFRWGKPDCNNGTKTSTARFARCVKVVTITE